MAVVDKDIRPVSPIRGFESHPFLNKEVLILLSLASPYQVILSEDRG
jgi:hypothetical protein